MMDMQSSRLRTAGTGSRRLPWHASALKLAVELRRENSSMAKIEIARAIFSQVAGAPRSSETISDWLRGLEESGELKVRDHRT